MNFKNGHLFLVLAKLNFHTMLLGRSNNEALLSHINSKNKEL